MPKLHDAIERLKLAAQLPWEEVDIATLDMSEYYLRKEDIVELLQAVDTLDVALEIALNPDAATHDTLLWADEMSRNIKGHDDA